MNRKKVLFLNVIIIFVLLLVFSGSYAQEKVWTLKLGSKMVEKHVESEAIKKFMEIVEEKSGGRLKFDSYFGEILGNSKTQLENVTTGLQDFYVESYTFFANYLPEFRVHSLPYLFDGNEGYKKFLLSPIMKEMEKKLLEKVGLRIINENKNWLRGPYRIIASRYPIKSLEDVKGLKLRQPDNQPTIKTWSAFGASVSIIPYSETYLAIQQGMVDAVTCPIANLYSDKFYELIDHATITHEYQQQVAIVMNNKKFESLPEDLQDIIIDAANEAGDYNTERVNEVGIQMREKLVTEYGMNIYEIDLNPWRKKAAEVHKDLEKSGFIPEGLIDEIKNYLNS